MEKIYELLVEDETDLISAISLVEMPAIEEPFIYFGNEEIKFSKVENEKRMLIGPILIPDKHIFRLEADGTPYKVWFSKQTVSKLAQNYLKNKLTDSATLEHGDKKIKGVHLVESWIKEGKLDKSNNYGMNMPEGTWMGIFYIDTTPEGETIWNDYVKTGKVKGFSVEALVTHKLVKASQHYLDKDINDLNEEEANLFLGQIKAIIKKDKRFKKKERIEFESYSDYPEGVKNNARRALDWVEKNGWGSCGTPVGKQRVNQLAKGEPISVDTIKRIYSYVSRHEVDLETSKSFGDGCGYLMMMSWGGLAAGRWAHNKLKELGLLEEAETNPSITSTYPGEVASGSVAPALK